MGTVDSSQIRAARGLLDWTQAKLAQAAGVSVSTLQSCEKGKHTPIQNNMTAICRALESAGVKFIDRGKSGGPGVRLVK